MVTYHVELHLRKSPTCGVHTENRHFGSVEVRAHSRDMALEVALHFADEMGWPHSRFKQIDLVDPSQYVRRFEFPDSDDEDK